MTWFENLSEQLQNDHAFLISLVSLGVSCILLLVRLWEAFWKDRIKLETSYFLTGEKGEPNEIVIANLSPLPVQVSDWELAWEPRWFAFWLKQIDVSPDETWRFKINGRDVHEISYEFLWNGRAASGRHLVLRLKLFGRRRRVRLVVGAGQEPDWSSTIRKRLTRLRS
ncbi:hypothetical protein [Cereibacter sphaeroides]|uniref:hypothetical protein n=1 Tax=Cereibacter sphaeroides TaxID=1063 RepID=UPI003FCD1F2E